MINEKKAKIVDMLNCQISDELLYRILFEMNRYFDKDFTFNIHSYQKQAGRIFNQNERNLLRKYYYYKMDNILELVGVSEFASIEFNEEQINFILDECLNRCLVYGEDNIINSIKERKINIEKNVVVDNSNDWLNYYYNKRENKFDYSLFVLEISQSDFKKNNYDLGYYFKVIAAMYDRLENYRHLIIKIKEQIYNKERENVTWKIIYKLGVYLENFVQFNGKFHAFKKDKSINKLAKFLDERFESEDNLKLATSFYSSISTGFKYEDCYIGENQDSFILVYKKIALDESPIPCPSCMTTIQSGNSYPELFLRSYECKNPSCADRSKSGRGKRFDEFSVYRYFKLVENKEENHISSSLYEKWRRDIFDSKDDIDEMIYRYYAWDNEKICVYPLKNNQFMYGRQIINCSNNFVINDNYLLNFEELPLVKLLSSICNLITNKTGSFVLTDSLNIINKNSSVGVLELLKGQVGSVITSPPYYNAREYSQWPTLIMYLIDMMINASSIYSILSDDGVYLYNIGDIVNNDNVYVESNMSKRRLQLGFLSCLFFELLGFNLVGNIIWDKGQVQSKRNSTVNLNSGYIKCINCYEHVFVLKKGKSIKNQNVNIIKYFSPVIKINSKGENTYKHTAPYPLEMVELLKPFINKDKYVLDPYLGSGTTLLWCKQNGYKGIGYELNEDYYRLSCKRVLENSDY